MAPSNLVGTLHFGGCWGGRADEQNDRNFLSAARLFSERQAGWLARLGLCQHPDQALLEGVDVGAQFARCARMNQPAPGDHADLAREAPDFLCIMAAEKRGDVFCGRKPLQVPLSRLAGRSSPRVGSSRKSTF